MKRDSPAGAPREAAGRRIACLRVPLFPLAARLRSEPELRLEAAAVFQGNGHAARIVAATRRARRAGVRRGMTLPQARALLPRLAARPRDAECERAARESLLEVAEGLSPRVEDAGEGVVFLDVAGMERHFPGGEPERALGEALVAAAARAGLPARAGIASSKLAARVAAEAPDSPAVVAAGDEAAFLAPLPLARLSPEASALEALRRWGIRSIGELARLPRDEVAARLGAEGRRLHRQALGRDRRPLLPHAPPPAFHEGLELDWPLVALEPFQFVARAALERLCRRLETRGLACARLTLDLTLEPDGHDARSLELPAPTREVKTLLTLVRLDLERRPPGAPVTGFAFTAWPDRPRRAQLTLFGPRALSPDRLATTLARLFALLGGGGVGSPRPVDGYRPERCTLVDFTPPEPPAERPEVRPSRGLLAVRVLRPPLALEVIAEGREPAAASAAGAVAEADAGAAPAACPRPLELRPAAGTPDGAPEIAGRVEVASGPWAVEEGWWSEDGVARDYWDVELAGGALYRIYRDRATGDWLADGIYD